MQLGHRPTLGISDGWTRREFVRGASGMLALAKMDKIAAASHLASQTSYAYVACGVKGDEYSGSIDVFRISDQAWSKIQSVPSQAPASLAISHQQHVLYVANEVGMHNALPRGSVEAFRINHEDGRLARIGCQSLSLSATHPRQMSLSPDGRLLAVAAYGGGIYNLLPIGTDGGLGRPVSISKATGRGSDPIRQASAHPYTVIFDASGRRLLSSDFGSDRLSVFKIDRGQMRKQMHQETGGGAGACLLHPSGSSIYVSHDLEGTLACHPYDSTAGSIGAAFQRTPWLQASSGTTSLNSLAIHPSGRMLYATSRSSKRIDAWHIDQENGTLAPHRSLPSGDVEPLQILVAQNGESALVVDGSEGHLLRLTLDRNTGEFGSMTHVTQIKGARSVTLRTV